jgi:hypothetical protein
MIRRTLVAVAAFFAVCFSLSAQSPGPIQPGFFALNQLGPGGVAGAQSALAQAGILPNNTYDGLASLTLADGRFFSFPSAFGWMELTATPDFLPATTLEAPRRVAPVATTYRTDAGTKAMELLPRFDYAHGEVGFLYGKSSGKFGREVKEGYILSEFGNDKTQITVGASYGQSNGRVPFILGH